MDDGPDLNAILGAQRAYWRSGVTQDLASRRTALRALHASLVSEEAMLCEALGRDLGKSWHEAYETEVGLLRQECRHALSRLRSWAKPRAVHTPLSQFPARSHVVARPLGSVLVITPWNYPLLLSLGPVIGALAAGNTVVLKPSERSPASSAALRTFFARTFPPELAWCAPPERKTGAQLGELRWDHIFFIGGSETAHQVLRAAEKHLTPITLELGGKNPCIVDHTAPTALTARRVVWGKFLNAGQTCIAPDYLVVHESARGPLTEAVRTELLRMFGENPCGNPDYARIVDRAHFDHLCRLLGSHQPLIGGERDPDTLRFAPTVLLLDSWEDRLATEEVFGPILPVLTYRTEDELRARMAGQPDALSAYVFSRRTRWARQLLHSLRCGGGCVNDTISHIVPPELPFGGVGASGFGRYRGRAGFDTFSNLVGVLEKGLWFDLGVRYPPYAGLKAKLLRWFLG